ncbi:hypothetical protein EK21DRAFT_98528 [Setomelanomma holmii]|uniref:TEA domain-containing protein n=1 Tax=Setomelanomma holmii TaxID=210430 RepID=A0A9P4HGP4_9PLEO|nr:hypothetical protein EK21DRAFT_98528 [Setomelanomma holmii]
MELQQHRSCVLPNSATELEGTSLDTSQQRAVFQERSANWPHDFNAHNLPVQKRSQTSSPTANTYARRTAPRSEKQVEYELKRLYRMLQRSDKYQKYREKQPVMTVAEVLAKEARELAEQQAREAERPEFLEHAFWKALVRWPPMGRKKHMLDGALRGRNELIQDSIRRDTGITRDRKQVSSHLQVLKQHLANLPAVLVYMAAPEEDKKRHRARESSHAYQLTHLRERHHAQRTASAARYDYHAPNAQARPTLIYSSYAYGPTASRVGETSASPYSIANFTMLASADEETVHSFTRLASDGRINDLNVTDVACWRRQYPEFDFLQRQMESWASEGRHILVCDASMNVMTEVRPNAHLLIDFNLHTQRDLSVYESVECTTRFFDSGDPSPNPHLDGAAARDLKEHRTSCKFEASEPNVCGSEGCLTIAFGSNFWVNRMTRYQSLRHRDEKSVASSLLCLTATQDIYGIRPETGDAECILTILWRFAQTRNSAEVGSMKWRAVSFNTRTTGSIDQRWFKREAESTGILLGLEDGHDGSLEHCSTAAPRAPPSYHRIAQHHFDYTRPHSPTHLYNLNASEHEQPPQLQLDILASMQPDLEHPQTSAAPSASTDYSQQSLPDMSHNQDTVGIYANDSNDFDFHGGHITISGAFEPAINLAAYGSFASQSAGLDGLHALAGLDYDGYSLGLACADSNELVDNAAEKYHTYMNHSQTTNGHGGMHTQQTLAGPSPALTQGEKLVAHGLQDAHINVNPSLWNLQSPFHEDTAGGASDSVDCRKDSAVHGHGVGLGIGMLEMIERDQRARRY